MSASARHPALILSAMLALAALSGCADVRQNPTSSVVNGQDQASTQQASTQQAPAQQGAGAQQASPTNIPF